MSNPRPGEDTMVRVKLDLHWRIKALAVRRRIQVREWYEEAILRAVEREEAEQSEGKVAG